MSKGHKIVEGLKEAIAGDFARVTIEGQVWARLEVEWQSIETAPKDGQIILTYSNEWGCAACRWYVGRWVFYPASTRSGVSPTRWMPRPQNPSNP